MKPNLDRATKGENTTFELGGGDGGLGYIKSPAFYSNSLYLLIFRLRFQAASQNSIAFGLTKKRKVFIFGAVICDIETGNFLDLFFATLRSCIFRKRCRSGSTVPRWTIRLVRGCEKFLPALA